MKFVEIQILQWIYYDTTVAHKIKDIEIIMYGKHLLNKINNF